MSEPKLEVVAAPLAGGRSSDGAQFPLALRCASGDATRAAAEAWVRSQRDPLLGQLAKHGAILFRGFPLTSDADFDAFLRAFELPAFSYAESLSNAVRRNRTERVFTANEAPPSTTIRLHHEMAQTPVHPSKLFFFCEKPAEVGGATPLCRSDALFAELQRSAPDFARDCEQHGLRYSLVMPAADDPASGVGRSWRSTFGVAERAEAEARMRRLGYSWEWLAGDCLRTTTPVLPAVRQLGPGRQSFFNQLIATLAWEDPRNDPAGSICLGDGRAVDPAGALLAVEIAESLAVDLVWERSDVALVDNYVVMHGRRRFEGTRAVLASLVAAA